MCPNIPTARIMTEMMLSRKLMATLRRMLSKSPAPKNCPVMTVRPLDMPMVIITSSIKIGAAAPTAASALTPMVRPTIIMSDMLYIC